MIKIEKYGIIHAVAQCRDCDWDDAIDISEIDRSQKLRNRIYSHVRKTKHKVTLETGNATDYYYE